MQIRKRDTDVQNRLLDSMGEGEGGMFQENSIKTCILSRVKQITSPGWMHVTSAWTWCTGKSQRDRVEREVKKNEKKKVLISSMGFPVAHQQTIYLPIQETQVRSLGWEDALEKELATYSTVWYYYLGNPMDRGTWWATVRGIARISHDIVT